MNQACRAQLHNCGGSCRKRIQNGASLDVFARAITNMLCVIASSRRRYLLSNYLPKFLVIHIKPIGNHALENANGYNKFQRMFFLSLYVKKFNIRYPWCCLEKHLDGQSVMLTGYQIIRPWLKSLQGNNVLTVESERKYRDIRTGAWGVAREVSESEKLRLRLPNLTN